MSENDIKNGDDPPDYEEKIKNRVDEIEEKIKDDQNETPEITSKFVADCLNSKELGDGILYSAILKGRFIYNKSASEWYRWAGHHFERDIKERALAHVEDVADRYLKEAYSLVAKINDASKKNDQQRMEHLKDLQSSIYKRVSFLRTDRGRQACLKYAKTNREYPLDALGNDFDQKPWLLACNNGVIDLRTGELRPGRPDDFLLKAIPHDYTGIDTPAPNWELAVKQIFDGNDELINYNQRLLGYAITGLNIEHILPIYCGDGRNGKGTIVESLAFTMGELAAPIPSEMLLDQGRHKNSSGPTPDIMMLRGLRIAFASESDENRKFSPSRVKWLSGGDTLTGRNPHDKYPTTFEATHTLIMLTNDKPMAPAHDFAFWERICLIPFTKKFVMNREPVDENEVKADKGLKERLKKEASGILAWLVRGCLEWQKEGLFKPAIVKEATEQYRRDEDILADWIAERCYLAPEATAQASEAYDDFAEWFAKNVSKKVLSQRKFGKMLTKRFHKEKTDTYTYFGIGLLESPSD